MKKLLPILLLMTLPVVFDGCSKDNGPYYDDEVAIRDVYYNVNGEEFAITLRGEQEWNDFVNMLFDRADEGCVVLFQCTSTTYEQLTADTKKPLSFKTTDRGEAQKWASEKGKQGYVVIVSYDKKNKVYKCQATK